jgi:NAD(P)-dependent dehydrogenase (short-subunit alcohol dehydrogenase family)
MQTAVITGSAGGLGAGLALAFYKRGFNVVISDLDQSRLDERLAIIESESDRSRLLAIACNVTDPAQVQVLWDGAVKRFGRVDYWINNAGLGGTQAHIIDSELERLLPVIDVNLKGVVTGTKIALMGMRAQGGGRIYNTAGFGVDGMIRAGMVIYGTTKRAVGYFTQAVAKEQKGTNISLGWINPGMVVTPMVVNGARNMGMEKWRKGGRIVFNLFGETPEVTGDLVVEKILADKGNSTFIKILTGGRAMYCLLRALFKKRDLFAEYGV